MFETVEMAPQDAILGLVEAFRTDLRAGKVNLSVGVYLNEHGITPILKTVKLAEKKLVQSETTKTYLGMAGSPDYGQHVQRLLFGQESSILRDRRATTFQTPGGTAALRVAGELLKKVAPDATLWLSNPTWANHQGIFSAAGMAIEQYPYADTQTQSLTIDKLVDALSGAKPGDVVLLHACCHNPTGIDPSPDEWEQIIEVIRKRELLPLVDFAYQGFAEGIEEDATPLRKICAEFPEAILCSSFSKNFGLYCERTGAVTFLAADADAASRVASQAKLLVRRNYSNPPSHGAAVVTAILADLSLRMQWEEEVTAMRGRIHQMRNLLVDSLEQKGAARDFSFIRKQHGMFSNSGLSPEQVDRLREEHAVYIVGSGRINVAGLTPENIEPVSAAIAAVL